MDFDLTKEQEMIRKEVRKFAKSEKIGSLIMSSLVVIITVIFLVSSDAQGCGVCAWTEMDRILPPIGLWILFSIIWFLAASIAVTTQKNKESMIPKIAKTGIIFISVIVLDVISGSLPGGILFFAFFLLIPFIINVFSLLKPAYRAANPILTKITYIGLICLLILILFTIKTLDTYAKHPSIYILKHGGMNGMSPRIKLRELSKNGKEYLPEMRKILATKGGSEKFYREQIISGIMQFGKAEIHIPILLEIMDENNHYSKDSDMMLQYALQKLSGLKLPENASAAEWKEALKNKQ